MSLSCLDCSGSITRMAKTGRCRKCARARHTPETETLRIAAMCRTIRRPEMLVMKRRVARENARAHLTWMPLQYHERYRHLRKRKGFNSADAQRLIREQMKVDSRGLDPFAAALIFAGLAA